MSISMSPITCGPVRKQGFWSRLARTSAPASAASPAQSTFSISDIEAASSKLFAKVEEQNLDLQDKVEALSFTKEFLDGRVTSLEQQCQDLDRTKQECEALRVSTCMLETELASSKQSIHMLQDGLDFASSCRRKLKSSVRAKEQDIIALEERLGAAQPIGSIVSCETATLKQSLQDAQSQLSSLRLSVNENAAQSAQLQADLAASKAAHDSLLREHEQQAVANSQLVDSLQAENNTLASQVAITNAKANKFSIVIGTFQSQVQVLGEFHVKQQQQQEALQAQVDAMYAQQQHDRQQFAAQLQAKDAANKALEAKLQQSESAAANLIISRGDEIAALKAQIQRVTLDLDSERAQTEVWAEYANRLKQAEQQAEQ